MNPSDTEKQPKTITLILWLCLFMAGLLAMRSIFAIPSEQHTAGLFGLSAQRLALTLLPFLGTLLGLAMLIMGLFLPDRYKRVMDFIGHKAASSGPLTAGISFWVSLFTIASILIIKLAVLPQTETLTETLGPLFPNLCMYLQRLLPLMAFLAVAMLCWVVYIAFVLKIPFYKKPLLFWGLAAGVLSLFATVFQWLVFIFRLHVFEQIPGWYWPIIIKPDLPGHALLLAGFLLAALLIVFLIRKFPKASLLYMVLIFLLFIGLQVAIGFMEGRGLASLTDRFFLSYHRMYLEEACNSDLSAVLAVTQYENLYKNMFFQTKPPGVLWMAFMTKKLAEFPPLANLLDRLTNDFTLSFYLPSMQAPACGRIMVLVTLLFPILAGLTVWAMAAFARRLIGGKDAKPLGGYSALFFILAPNVIMLSLFNDQALYPLLFLLTAGGILYFIKQNRFIGNFVMGMLIYGVFFLSFTMLPLAVIPVLYFACLNWQEKDLRTAWQNFKHSLLPMGLGGLLGLLILKLTLGYDIITRYRNMMATRIEGDFYVRLGIEAVQEAPTLTKVRQTLDAAFLNNIELAASIGFPIFIFFLVMGITSLIRVIKRKPTNADPLNATLFLTYAALNALRVVLGEVGRLYMFWIPAMSLLAMQFLMPAIKRKWWLIFLLVTVQFITVLLTYQYQDFLMPADIP